MAWVLKAHTQFVSSGGAGAGGTIAFTTTGADILIAHAAFYTGVNELSLSSSLSGSFTGLTEHVANTVSSRIFYIKNPTVGSDTITITGATTYPVVQLFAFSGSNTTAPFDVENGATASNLTSLSSGAVTPTNDGELIISGVVVDHGSQTAFTNASFTITDFSNFNAGVSEGGAGGYVVLGAGTAGSAYTPNAWGWSGSGVSFESASIAAFIAAAAGGSTRPVKMVGRWGGYAGASGGFAA